MRRTDTAITGWSAMAVVGGLLAWSLLAWLSPLWVALLWWLR